MSKGIPGCLVVITEREREIKLRVPGEQMYLGANKYTVFHLLRAKTWGNSHTGIRMDKKNQLDVTFCILYLSSNSCSTCFGQPCAHHQELTTA